MDRRDRTSPKRAALVLIHGIGQQRPYETMDAFARGLVSSFGAEEAELEHRLEWRDGPSGRGTRSFLRVELPEPAPRSGAREVDVHEFYWAGLVQGRIRLRQVLAWVARTALTPLRSWAHQPEVLFREKGALGKPLWTFARELLRAGGLLVLAAAVLLPFLYTAYNAGAVERAGRTVWGAVAGTEHPLWLAVWTAGVFLGAMLARGWVQLLRRRLGGRDAGSPEDGARRSTTRLWFFASAVTFLFVAAAAYLTQGALGVVPLVTEVAAALWSGPVLAPLAAAGIAFLLRRYLVRYVGDIALYVTADERSEFYRTRDEILRKLTGRLHTLFHSGEYDGIFLAGHSLGSVIAYDALNRIAREARAVEIGSDGTEGDGAEEWGDDAGSAGAPPGKLTREDLDRRLWGLLTFGSPLDKVHYFFRTIVEEDQTVREQILTSLHGFRRVDAERAGVVASGGGARSGAGSDEDVAPAETREAPEGRRRLEVDCPPIPDPSNFEWRNVYSPLDPISGRLDFYRVDGEQCCRYYWPLGAHLAYWEDPVFYDLVREWL